MSSFQRYPTVADGATRAKAHELALLFDDLTGAQRGHYRTESGLHSRHWFDLDALLCHRRVAPLVDELAARLRRYDVDLICGPSLGGAFLAQRIALQFDVPFVFARKVASGVTGDLFSAHYRVPDATTELLRGAKVAVVDDVMSAGSSLRATIAAVGAAGAVVRVVGAICVMGDVGVQHLTRDQVAVEAAVWRPFELWSPDACPLCVEGAPLEDHTEAADVPPVP